MQGFGLQEFKGWENWEKSSDPTLRAVFIRTTPEGQTVEIRLAFNALEMMHDSPEAFPSSDITLANEAWEDRNTRKKRYMPPQQEAPSQQEGESLKFVPPDIAAA